MSKKQERRYAVCLNAKSDDFNYCRISLTEEKWDKIDYEGIEYCYFSREDRVTIVLRNGKKISTNNFYKD